MATQANDSIFCDACVGQISACHLVNGGRQCPIPGHEIQCRSNNCTNGRCANAINDPDPAPTRRGGGAPATGGSNAPINDPPELPHIPHAIHETPFAPPYRSIFTATANSNLRACLKHVNCSYLSTPGVAPTLTQLKQHAQCLTILIKNLTVSTFAAAIDNRNSTPADGLSFHDAESFDWLNDLTKPYKGPTNDRYKTHHVMPLTTIMNTLQKQENAMGQMEANDICPLHSNYMTPVNGKSLPYATHQSLIAHANDVLELLDHEYSAKGGLLSILPPKEEKEDRKKAEATLLGQFILYVTRLVQRLHDLERLYANSMDVLAGEAAVPLQALSKLGPDGRKEREMVFPQDRFVLVNAGDDVWQFLNAEFENKERLDQQVMEMYMSQGVTGEALWNKHGGKEYSRGITAIDITTRYYRLRKDNLKTIFVIPAHEQHPGTKVTREMEKQPTVVSVVKPMWPERQSQWEMKHRAELHEHKKLRAECSQMQNKIEVLKNAEATLQYDNDLKDVELQELKKKLAELPVTDLRRQLNDCMTQRASEIEVARQRGEDHGKANAEAEWAADKAMIAQERDAYTVATNRAQTNLIALRNQREQADRERAAQFAELDRTQAEVLVEAAKRLKEEWEQQLTKTLAVHEMLMKTAEKIDLNKVIIPQNIRDAAGTDARALVKAIVWAQQDWPAIPEPIPAPADVATGGGIEVTGLSSMRSRYDPMDEDLETESSGVDDSMDSLE